MDLRRRRAPGIAERDIVGAGVAGNHRGVARAAAGDPEDALGAERGAGRGDGPGRAEVDPVGAGLEREIDVVLEQERDAAGAQTGRRRRAAARIAARSGSARRNRKPALPPAASAAASCGSKLAGSSSGGLISSSWQPGGAPGSGAARPGLTPRSGRS